MKNINLKDLFQIVCEAADIEPSEVIGTRNQSAIDVKAVYCFFARNFIKELSLKKIAQVAGLTNHATVIHHINKTVQLPEIDKRKMLLRKVEVFLNIPQYIYVLIDIRDGKFTPTVAYFDEQKAKENVKDGFVVQQVRII